MSSLWDAFNSLTHSLTTLTAVTSTITTMSRSHTPSVPGTPTTDGPALTLADTFGRYTTSQNVVDLFARRIKDRFSERPPPRLAHLPGQHLLTPTVVVTGASPGGIGYETARAIATKEPALLVLAGRDRSK